MDSMICECGHSKYEHNPPSSWDDEDMDDTFCFYESCNCEKYAPIEIKTIKSPDKTIIVNKKECVVCGAELKNPIMLGETASKAWAKKNGYDGFQWRERKENVIAALKNAKEELLEPDPSELFPESVKFFTCMKHTDKNFDTVGEVAEVNED